MRLRAVRFRVVLALVAALIAFFGASVLGERVARASTPAPLCDERGASAYAAEPSPQPADDRAFAQAPEGGCRAVLATDVAASESHDDLSRTPDVPNDPAILPPLPAMTSVAVEGDLPSPLHTETRGDEHRQADSPPPKPVPWRV